MRCLGIELSEFVVSFASDKKTHVREVLSAANRAHFPEYYICAQFAVFF
jgi:hypothetical protein